MGSNDENNGKRQEPKLVIVVYLFDYQEYNANGKENTRHKTMVMLFKTMPEGQESDGKSQEDHEILESDVFDDIYPKNGQTCQ